MITVRCRLCGADFQTEESNKVDRCGFCASLNTIPKAKDARHAELFHKAATLRGTNYFEQGAAVYESILKEDPDNPEALFGLVMCEYGAEYAGDAWGRTLVCNRYRETKIFDDQNYKKAVKLADIECKEIYDNIAFQINGEQERFAGADTSAARCDVLLVSKQYEDKDILDDGFDPDDDNVPVKDFELARHIYDYLSRKGYRVFMTGKNLKNSRRQDAIPMLQTAIESAKILVLVGTSREYIDDASVESEWMRYFIVNRGVKNKGFAPCYYEMDPKDLPQEMLKSSPIDMSVEGYEEEILKRVAYYTSGSASGSASEATPAPKPAQPVQETPAAEEENVSAASANEPEAAPEQEEAGFGGMGFDEEELGFDILEATKIYDDAFAKEKKARFDYELKQIGDAYASIKGFRDSQARAQECYKRAEEIRQEALYQEALRSFHKCKDHVDYLRTRLLFETISGYKDADGRARECAILAKRVKKQQQQEIIDKEIEAIENKKAEAEKVVEQAKKKEEEEDKPSMVLRILVIVIALAAIGGLGFFFKDQIMNAVSYYQGLLG
ncbi:MAG: toll/interleukin-1 receptor domain-containing protein [Lachnospiraceae bacterium]|nr:toll/interleukin-1 receptor domain-containing protein [Lachnospiraceae bacterium]